MILSRVVSQNSWIDPPLVYSGDVNRDSEVDFLDIARGTRAVG